MTRVLWVEHSGFTIAQRDETIEGEEIGATWHHPYWVLDGADLDDRPVPDHLGVTQAGVGRPVPDHLGVIQAGVGPPAAITNIRLEQVERTVYNLYVDELHTYAVGAGGWLVHNSHSGGGSSKPDRGGKPFTKKGRQAVIDANKKANGRATCENCGKKLRKGKQSKKGQKNRTDEIHVDQIIPQSKGGAGAPSNGRVLCRGCNLKTGNKELF